MNTFPRREFHLIGWAYNHPRSTPLKSLLLHAACPWKPAAIVHDEIWVDMADGIPLMRTETFLALTRKSPVRLRACLQLQEPMQRQLWTRLARDHGFDLLDEGEIIQDATRALQTAAQECDLGVAVLPHSLDAEGTTALVAMPSVVWADATSARVFDAYLRFLQTGLLSPFERVWALRPANPLSAHGDSRLHDFLVANLDGMGWEIASERSNFLEQVCLLAGRRWRYAFSAPDDAAAQAGLALLRSATQTLEISFAGSVCQLDGTQRPVEGATQPLLEASARAVRIDLQSPGPWALALTQARGRCRLWVAAGRHPRQMLQALEVFRAMPGELRLSCHRPGPLGLELEWTNPAGE